MHQPTSWPGALTSWNVESCLAKSKSGQHFNTPWPKNKQTNKTKTNNNQKRALRAPDITRCCLFDNVAFVRMKQIIRFTCFTQPGKLFALSFAASANPNRQESSVSILVRVCSQEITSKPLKCNSTQVNELKIMTRLWVDFWLAFKSSRALIMGRPNTLQLCVIWLCMGRGGVRERLQEYERRQRSESEFGYGEGATGVDT